MKRRMTWGWEWAIYIAAGFAILYVAQSLGFRTPAPEAVSDWMRSLPLPLGVVVAVVWGLLGLAVLALAAVIAVFLLPAFLVLYFGLRGYAAVLERLFRDDPPAWLAIPLLAIGAAIIVFAIFLSWAW